MISACRSFFKPFKVISSGSPGPSDTKQMGYDMCVRIIWCAKVRKIAELSKSAFHNCGDNFHTAFSIARFLFFGMQFVLDGTIRKR